MRACVRVLIYTYVCSFVLCSFVSRSPYLHPCIQTRFYNRHSNAILVNANVIILNQTHTHTHTFQDAVWQPLDVVPCIALTISCPYWSAGPACKKLELFVIWLRYRKENVKQKDTNHTTRKRNVYRISTADSHSVDSRDRFSEGRLPILAGVSLLLCIPLWKTLR
jgi:hypothetical protein